MNGPADRGTAGDEPEATPSLQRLDPDRAAADRAAAPAPPEAPPERPPRRPVAVDPRPYRWAIGIIGLLLLAAFSVVQLTSHHGSTGTGVAPGHRLAVFAAPLADTDLNGDPTTHPTCRPGRHDPRALNVCLLARDGPLVLAFFVDGAAPCERQVDALQTLAGRFPGVRFAAVAVAGAHADTAAAVRRHHWTIPVAYDRDGAVQALYRVVACPMVELAARGGIVRNRLIGDRWQTAAALAPDVRALASGGAARG